MDETGSTQRRRLGQGCRPRFRFDALLLLFLIIGWSLIFVSATLALRRSPEQWLRVQIVPRVSADYSVTENEGQKLAPVRAEIIEAVRRDALVVMPSETLVASAEPTPSSVLSMLLGSTPTPSPSPVIFLVSSGGPYTATEGSVIVLAASATSRPGEDVLYRWDLNGDGRYDDAMGASTSYVFYENGEYRVGVQAIDSAGRVTTDLTTIMVQNAPPKVDAGVDRTAYEGERRSFSAIVTDPGRDDLFYYWDFGDGTPLITDENPEHTYLDNGKYTVRLRVEDDDRGFGESSFQISVSNRPPVAEAGLDQVVDEGQAVTLAGSATDPGRLDLDRLIYEWDLHYEGGSFTPDASGATVSALYSDGPALVVAALRVRDPDGAEAMDTLTVQVNNVVPAISSVTNNGPVGEGSPVDLVVVATDVASDSLTFDFDWDNDRAFEDVGRPGTVAYTWYDQGDYTVGIRVNDGDGGQVAANTTVSVYNVSPTAFAGAPVTGFEGATITFGGSGSDPGIHDTLTYVWNFSDGGVITSATASRVYPDNGDYTASLTVNDGDGGSGTHVVTATILNANPVVDIQCCETVKEGQSFNFVATASDAGAADTLVSVGWDFDYDGTNFTQDRAGTPVGWTYRDGPATYLVAFRALDDDFPYPTDGGGEIGEGLAVLQATVDNVPPVVDAGGPYYGHPTQPITLTGTADDVPADLPDLIYEWDLDGADTSERRGPTAVVASWNLTGIYTVTLRVNDQDGGIGSDTARVTIANRLPTVDVGGPYTVTEGITLTLTAVANDPDNDRLTYAWYVNTEQITGITGPTFSYAWPDNGTYTVTVRVDDGWGGTATDSTQVTVRNVPPIAEAGGPYTARPGQDVQLTGTAVDVPADMPSLAFDWDLDLNGTYETAGPTVVARWDAPGVYTVTLRVTDKDGDSGFDTARVNVTNQPPTVNVGGPYTAIEGIAVTLTATATDPDGDALTYTWQVAPGQVFVTTVGRLDYAWPDNGTYMVTVRVDDGGGGIATDSTEVNVENANPVAQSGGPYIATVDVPLTLTGTGDDVPADNLTFDWDLDNDGVFETPGAEVTSVWTTTGIYTVVLQARDDDGGSDTSSTTVDVSGLIPLAWPAIFYLLTRRTFRVMRRKGVE